MSNRPNLFIVGAMKSGTTSLHVHLSRHPDVFMSEPKEPGYFTPQIFQQDDAWYLDLFKDSEGHRYRGESSTHYTKLPTLPGAAERMQAFAPDARIIYIMRDPVERAISHYWHNVRDLLFGQEHRDALAAFQKNPEYLAFSDYAMQLRPYMEKFGPENVYTLTFEEFTREPEAQLAALLQWLGLPPLPAVENPEEKHNAQPPVFKEVRGLGLLNKFRHSRLWAAIAPLMPSFIKRMGNQMAERPAQRDDVASKIPEATQYARQILAPKVQELEALLGRPFPDWHTTRA